VGVGHEGGADTVAMYFTSEVAARKGERKQPPPELQAQMEQMAALGVGEPELFDLRQPWLYSPPEMDSPGLGAGILVGFGRRGRRTPNFAPDGLLEVGHRQDRPPTGSRQAPDRTPPWPRPVPR
jgi:hypothetical protein